METAPAQTTHPTSRRRVAIAVTAAAMTLVGVACGDPSSSGGATDSVAPVPQSGDDAAAAATVATDTTPGTTVLDPTVPDTTTPDARVEFTAVEPADIATVRAALIPAFDDFQGDCPTIPVASLSPIVTSIGLEPPTELAVEDESFDDWSGSGPGFGIGCFGGDDTAGEVGVIVIDVGDDAGLDRLASEFDDDLGIDLSPSPDPSGAQVGAGCAVEQDDAGAVTTAPLIGALSFCFAVWYSEGLAIVAGTYRDVALEPQVGDAEITALLAGVVPVVVETLAARA